jgi:hypothetical protein
VAGAVIAIVGGCIVAASIFWKWGHLAYGVGVTAAIVGCVAVVVLLLRHRLAQVAVGVVVTGVLAACAVVAVTGLPRSIPRWDDPEADGPGGWSARTGELFISGGTARSVATGNVVWELEADDALPSLVAPDVVVMRTNDETIGVETDSGREIWRSAIPGLGIARSGNVLVVSHSIAENQTEAVALDLATGETVWRRTGRPIMECAIGPTDRFSPAPERSRVLVIPDEANESHAELVDVTAGNTTVPDVDCSLTARVAGGVLLEASGDALSGRTLADGERLWTIPVDQPWIIAGGGSTVFTPTGPGDQASDGVTAIDVTTGKAREVRPPSGEPQSLSTLDVRRAPAVWIPLDQDSGAALWNPDTDAVVEVPDAASVEIDGVDVFSGWMALSGSSRDITGEEADQCWAVAQTGHVYGPVPGGNCVAADGVLQTSDGVYPLQ